MKFQNVYIEDVENYNYESKLLNSLGEELSLIIWVMIVLVLIIFSYMTNQKNLSNQTDAGVYEKLSISEEIKLEENINRFI